MYYLCANHADDAFFTIGTNLKNKTSLVRPVSGFNHEVLLYLEAGFLLMLRSVNFHILTVSLQDPLLCLNFGKLSNDVCL